MTSFSSNGTEKAKHYIMMIKRQRTARIEAHKKQAQFLTCEALR